MRRVILEDQDRPLMWIGTDEDLSRWPMVTVEAFRNLLYLIAFGVIFVAICAVGQ